MTETEDDRNARRAAFDRLIGELRPKLHRYCARMTGSVIDGEDIVQEALVKAIAAHPGSSPIDNPEAWLFRVAHNLALDHLRRRSRREAAHAHEDLEMIPDPVAVVDDRQAAAASLHTFMRLPVAQRSSVILMDVLGHTVQEVAGIIGGSVPAVKAALHRGRNRLRALAREPDDASAPALDAAERARLAAYVDRFNARDFDAVRAMLADDVRLELVNRLALKGRGDVGTYLHRYDDAGDWRFVAGWVDGRTAIIVIDPEDPDEKPKYFIVLEWRDGVVSAIRDFLFARYAIDGARLYRMR
ncbi:MAG: sigma-70 family RNA polymerase sigma factor [Rhodospirillales bacterium]